MIFIPNGPVVTPIAYLSLCHVNYVDDPAYRNGGALVKLADRDSRWCFIQREHHFFAGYVNARDMTDECSLSAHLGHH